jgi:hypothetical protein
MSRRSVQESRKCGMGVAGRMAIGTLVWLATITVASAQQPPVHYWHPVGLPPGAIGSRQLQRGGPLPGFFQPVEIKAPEGVSISLAEEGRFSESRPTPLGVGMLVGCVYRVCAFNLPFRPGVEVYPTIEVIDRLYAPPGQETRFPIQIELAREDLDQAADGKFVTRVVYLENPEAALPAQASRTQPNWFDAPPGSDPLAVADALGRPVAIVRVGGRVPDRERGPDAAFLFGCPPLVKYAPRPSTPTPAAKPKKYTEAKPSAKPNPASPAVQGKSEDAPR